MSAVVLLYKYSSMSFGFLLTLTALVIAISLLDHTGSVIKLTLLAIGQSQTTQVSFAVGDSLVTAVTIVIIVLTVMIEIMVMMGMVMLMTMAVAAAIQLELQLEELAEVGGRGRGRG